MLSAKHSSGTISVGSSHLLIRVDYATLHTLYRLIQIVFVILNTNYHSSVLYFIEQFDTHHLHVNNYCYKHSGCYNLCYNINSAQLENNMFCFISLADYCIYIFMPTKTIIGRRSIWFKTCRDSRIS